MMKTPFFAAQAYHQDYAIKHPWELDIAMNDAPKVENLKQMFPDVVHQPVTVAEAGGLAVRQVRSERLAPTPRTWRSHCEMSAYDPKRT